MADAGAVDVAVLEVLAADAVLLAFCPGGVFYGSAPPSVESVVIVDRLAAMSEGNLFGTGPAWETFTYLVKAVIPGTSAAGARQAAARIRAILDGNTTIAPAGYALIRPVAEVSALPREPEIDDADRYVQHWGGQYELVVQRIQ